MTLAVCTNCGELKYGALCSCPSCKSQGLGFEISILLSDHNLYEHEMRHIGKAISIISQSGLSEDIRFHLLAYFLSRKWPKLMRYQIGDPESEDQKSLDVFYNTKLCDLIGQEAPSLRISPISKDSWTRQATQGFLVEDENWQLEVKSMVLEGLRIADDITTLLATIGEGSPATKLGFRIKGLFKTHDFRTLIANTIIFLGNAKEYSRKVDHFSSRIRNGWSERTKEQVGYFRGFCARLLEMAEECKTICEHKAGRNPLIKMEIERSLQQFKFSRKLALDLSRVVMNPSRINPNGTCKQ